MKIKIFILVFCGVPFCMHAQLTMQRGATFYLQEKTELSNQGDLEASDNIDGEGSIILNGATCQSINAHNYRLPNLVIDNPSGVTLSSPVKINKSITLHKGHISLNNHNLELGSQAVAYGVITAYILTDGEGKVIKSVERDLDGFVIPVGSRHSYAPLLFQTSGRNVAGNISVAAKDNPSPNKPSDSKDYLESYWTVERSGLTGELTATAFYNKVSGNEANLHPYYWNGISWI